MSGLLRLGWFGAILPNLQAGPPADPLPAVRAKRPTAAETASHRRPHPYLFFDAASWLDTEIKLRRDRFYPSALAPDGKYDDAWDHFESTLDDPIPFLAALKQRA